MLVAASGPFSWEERVVVVEVMIVTWGTCVCSFYFLQGVIDFKEFVKGLNVFAQTASQEEKLRCECVHGAHYFCIAGSRPFVPVG